MYVPQAGTWEPYETRVSRTVLRGPAGEIPAGYSTENRPSKTGRGARSLNSRMALRLQGSLGAPPKWGFTLAWPFKLSFGRNHEIQGGNADALPRKARPMESGSAGAKPG